MLHYYNKALFPIVLAYAMTGHKSQGATISIKVIVDIWNAFALGLTYVMLSRTKNRQNLKIVRKLLPSNFIPCPFLNTPWSSPLWTTKIKSKTLSQLGFLCDAAITLCSPRGTGEFPQHPIPILPLAKNIMYFVNKLSSKFSMCLSLSFGFYDWSYE